MKFWIGAIWVGSLSVAFGAGYDLAAAGTPALAQWTISSGTLMILSSFVAMVEIIVQRIPGR